MKKYRISIDDNIEFLRDLTVNDYENAFDNPFLQFIKFLHNSYGAYFCLNLFYQNYDSKGFCPKKPDFCLADMTEKYKADFVKSSDWLKFSFHSKSENPPFPYKESLYDEVYRDGLAVNSQILRFAGESSLTDEITLHCGLCTKDGFRALSALGYKIFYGFFNVNESGQPRGSYYFDVEFLKKHPDRIFTQGNYIFKKTDMLLNAYKSVFAVEKDMQKLLEDESDFYEIMFHEQYFYSNYNNYIRDYRNIIEAAVRVIYKRGYSGGYLR